MTNAFSPDPSVNTSPIYFTVFLISRIFLAVSGCVSTRYSPPSVAWKFIVVSAFRLLAMAPYFALLSFAPNGDQERENLRIRLWSVGIVFDFLAMYGFSVLIIFKLMNHESRPALSMFT
jgi:hypothetical protein